jgi:hypothetical protein
MWRRKRSRTIVCGIVFALTTIPCASPAAEKPTRPAFSAAMHSAEQITDAALRAAKTAGQVGIVLELKGGTEKQRRLEKDAAERIRKAGFELHYWIEIARNPALADKHPLWMASLQGHQEWRRLFKDVPKPKAGEVVKVYPWVPILYREAFDAHLKRVAALLKNNPTPKTVFLNDLQGPPSACGCGNTLCRWTADYGPIKTATHVGDDAAAKFLAAVGRIANPSARTVGRFNNPSYVVKVIPVWLTECEEHDGHKDGWCAGVGCYRGICWRAWTKQLMPVAKAADRIAVLATYRELKRDLPAFKQKAGWVRTAIESFQTMPPRRGGKPVEAKRLIAVVQGWKVTPAEIDEQRKRALEAGAGGLVVSYVRINQDWRPRVVRYRKAAGKR